MELIRVDALHECGELTLFYLTNARRPLLVDRLERLGWYVDEYPVAIDIEQVPAMLLCGNFPNIKTADCLRLALDAQPVPAVV